MAKITKLYEITLAGAQQMVQDLNTVNTTLNLQKKIVREVKAESKGIFDNDKQLNNYRASLEKLNKELLKSQTVSKIIKNDNEAYLRVSKALNEVEKERSASIIHTYESLKKANSEAKAYYSSKTSAKLNSNPFSNYQSTIGQNFDNLKSKGKTVEFALGYVAEQKKIEDAQKRLNFEQSEYGKELAKTNLQISKQRAENKNAAKEALGLADAYDKLSKKQIEAFNIAKQVGADKGIYSREFQKAAGEANYYDQQLKKIDFALGRFNRNVGNYRESMFGLNNTMAQVMREMPAFTNSAQTGFMAISNNLPMLADAIQDVKVRNAELKQEFLESAAAAKKMATDEAIAAGASLELAAAKGAEAEAMVLANYQAQKSPSIWKQLASSVFSWQSLMAIGITLLTVYGADIIKWADKMLKGSSATAIAAENTKDLNKARVEGMKSAAAEISQLDTLYRVATNENLTREQRIRATDKMQKLYPTVLKNFSDEAIMAGNAANKYLQLRDAILESARARAISDTITKRYEEQLTKEEKLMNKLNGLAQERKRLRDTGATGTEIQRTSMQDKGGVIVELSNEEMMERNAQSYFNYHKQLLQTKKEFNNQNKALIDEQIRIEGKQNVAEYQADKYGTDPAKVKSGKVKDYSGSKLSGEQKDALADILASKDNELSALKEKQQKGLIMEEDYWTGYKAITSKYRDQILSFLDGSNAKERKITADQRKKAIDEISRANEELYNINRKRIEDELSNSTKKAENEKNLVLDSVYSTEQEKIDAENRFHSESYQNQLIYTQRMLDLNNEYHRTVKEETDAYLFELEEKTRIANQSNLISAIKTTEDQVEVAGEGRDYLLNQHEINAAIAQRVILNDKTLTQEQQKAALEKVSAELALRNINVQLGYTDALIRIYELARESRKLTNKEELIYNNLLKEREQLLTGKASQENENKSSGYVTPSAPGSGTSGLGSMLTNSLKNKETGKINLGKDKKGNAIDGTEMIGYGIAQAFDLASLAMNNYFDGERQRIEQSRQLAYERIDLERQQLMRYSQSNAEREAIDKQAAEKKKRADKQAGEQLKKQKKNEAKIAFLMELANIWSSVWSMGNPIVAAIMGGALSVLAGARYAMTVSSINKTQYGRGGLFGRGGRLSGPSHSDGGMPVLNPVTGNIEAEMEGKEGIINAKAMSDNSVYSVTGTPSQIASRINKIGGGVDWFGGATLRKFESGGIFNWNRAQPPVFSSMVPRTDVEQAGSERLDRIEGTLELLSREGFKKVVLNPNDVTAFQKEQRKQTEIGTL